MIALGYGYISLREIMKRFQPHTLMKLASFLDVISASDVEQIRDAPVSEERKSETCAHIAEASMRISELGFPASFAQAVQKFADLASQPVATFGEFRDRASRLKERIDEELDSIVFLSLDPTESALYDLKMPFGDAVDQQFGSAALDIEEAGKCLATGRSTACVMHLMRVLESGLNVFATDLKVPFANTNWENVIDLIEKAIKGMNNSWGDDWKGKQQRNSEAAVQFRFFKNAWRNHAMHVHQSYTPEQATEIWSHVKSFMQHLATWLHE